MDEGLGVRAGSSADFERLLRANAQSMLRFADFVLHDRSAAEDAVQEAFMIAFQRRGTLRDQSAFAAWLRTIALRESLRWDPKSQESQEQLQRATERPRAAQREQGVQLAPSGAGGGGVAGWWMSLGISVCVIASS